MAVKKTSVTHTLSKPKPITQAFLLKHALPLIKSKGKLYSKHGDVLARLATRTQTIVTIISSGAETTNTAKKGDYIVTNNKTQTREEYVVPAKKFKERYKKQKQVTKNTALYSPLGKVLAIRVTKTILNKFNWPVKFHIQAPWKEKQYVSLGDYLVCPLTEDEIYRIGYKEFLETYKKD